MTGFLATPADENEFAGRLVPSEPAPFLRLRRFNELAVFSEEKKNGALFIGSRVTPRINDANNTLAGLKPSNVHNNRLHVCWRSCVNDCMRAFPGLLLIASGFLHAQSGVMFEAAHIQLDSSSDRPSGEYKNGRMIIHNHSLRSLIGAAYHVPNINIQGPSWLDDVRFDISAKTEPAVTEEASRAMLQTLLSEQLKLEIHREERSESAYSMVLANGGLKVHEAPSDPEKITNCSVMKRGELTCPSVSLESFAKLLGSFVGDGLPVRDGTGLKGQYGIHLTWTEGSSGPTLFEALQQQLGLKLQGRKLRIEYIVVDHVERVPLDQ